MLGEIGIVPIGDPVLKTGLVAITVRLMGGLNLSRGAVDQRSDDRPGLGAVAVWIRPFGGVAGERPVC